MARTSLDCRNLLCPMPVIRVQAAVAKLAAGDELAVYATDPGALQDIPAWCRVHGHAVLSSEERDGEVYLLVRVGGGASA
ncbi:sulfurtransferase TusA family protein [Halorhodospira neutriphila]|uniref:SirA family protein n=1 Tax=Halorhodospira neutriphila TaxID=168379 RepID=A0ABS1E2N5_9GAMM|nr:sulfurtransferase TusA family protein [Halorhodospira neutriphila]MBK1725956.1 SirA family protein [Halorhodospira neutriphila]